jgi:hypothetical protein
MVEVIAERGLWSFLSSNAAGWLVETDDPQPVRSFQIRKDPGVIVQSYIDLVQKVATVQYYNPDYVFLFRGQCRDYLRGSASTLKPPIFRAGKIDPPEKQGIPSKSEIKRRYTKLNMAERLIQEIYPHKHGRTRLRRQRIIRWAILQHYKVCDTPLLDLTQSLRIAASFATDKLEPFGYVYMLGFPSIAGPLTASAEAALQLVRLSTACPPEAWRPHVQEGFLIGEYPDIDETAQREDYRHAEFDFGRRVVAKFRFDSSRFWRDDSPFPLVPHGALFPDDGEALVEISKEIRERVESNHVHPKPRQIDPG